MTGRLKNSPALIALLATATLAIVGLAGIEPAVAAGSVRVAPGTARVGEAVRVEVLGWPAGIVEVSLCGNSGARGSQDCAVSQARTIALAAASTRQSKSKLGSGFTLLTIDSPPAPCPCVVRAVHREAGLLATAPVTIRGNAAKAAKPGKAQSTAKPVARSLRVMSTSMVTEAGLWSWDSWSSWWGIRTERTLRLTVRNTGTVTVRDPAWSLSVGRTGSAATVVSVPALGDLKPGAEKTVQVPVTLSAPVAGNYLLTGSIDGLDSPVPVAAELSSWPWAIPAAIALLALVLLRLPPSQAQSRARRRRRSADSASSAPAPIDTPTKVRS